MSRSLWVWMVVGAMVVAFGCLRWALAEEDCRRFVERGVDFGKPGRPARVPTVRPVDDEGDASDDDGGQCADDPGREPLRRGRRFGRAGRERGGFRHEPQEACPVMGPVSTGSAIGSGSV